MLQSAVKHRWLYEQGAAARGINKSKVVLTPHEPTESGQFLSSYAQLLPEHVRKECFLLWGRIWLLKQNPTSSAYQ